MYSVPARPPFPVAAPAPPMPGFMAPPAPQMQPPPPQPPPPVSRCILLTEMYGHEADGLA